MYSVHYLPHPFDKSLRDQEVKAYCLCREVRLPIEEGHARGKQIIWEPVAVFNRDSDGYLFEEFCHASVDPTIIEPRQEFTEMKREVEAIRKGRSATRKDNRY